MRPARLALAFALMIALDVNVCSSLWYQNSGDCGATNYVNFTGKQFNTGWNYSSGASMFLYENLAVSPNGTLFTADNVGGLVGITAVSSKGKVLWRSKALGTGWLSNLIHDPQTSTIVVAGVNIDYSNSTLFNINANNGKIRWGKAYSEIRTSTSLSMSNVTNAVYLGDYDNKNIIAVSLKDGSVMWNKTGLIGVYEDQPTGVSCDGKTVFLPTDVNGGGPSNGTGTIIAYAADTGKELWSTATNFSIYGGFACGGGILVGLVGDLGPGGDGIFAISVADGTLLWKMDTLCKCMFYGGTSGPVVDKEGNSYFSCGNQVYSIDSKGNKRWFSSIFGKEKNNTCGSWSPSLHPKGFVYFIHSNKTVMYSLSTTDGSVASIYKGSTNTTQFTYPPILVGEKFFYVVMGSPTVKSMKFKNEFNERSFSFHHTNG